MNEFEDLLRTAKDHGPDHFYRACRDVGDTAYMAKVWFESYGFTPTAADIVAMTTLMMRRGREIAIEEIGIDEGEYDDA